MSVETYFLVGLFLTFAADMLSEDNNSMIGYLACIVFWPFFIVVMFVILLVAYLDK